MTWPVRNVLGLILVLVLGTSLIRLLWRLENGPSFEVTTPPTKPIVQLDPKKQRLIWENEHTTFKIETHFGRAFLAAWSQHDRSRMRGFFRDGCAATILQTNRERHRRHRFVTESYRDNESVAEPSVPVDKLVGTLLSRLQRFASIERNRLKVLEIERAHDTPRCRMRLLVEFVGVDDEKKPLLYYSEHRVEGTINDETQLDKTASIDRWTICKEIVRHSERVLLEEVTQSVGLEELPIPDNWQLPVSQVKRSHFQVAVADYNQDGWLDIAVAVSGGEPILLRSEKGQRFENVAKQSGLTRDKGSHVENCFVACWLDFDNDGWPDLLLGDRLYRNREGKRFEDVTHTSGLRLHQECMGAVTADYDCDGLVDLYLLYQSDHENSHGHASAKWVDDKTTGKANQLWHNEGGGRFRDVTAASGAGGGKRHTFAAAWFFYDDDHYPDLYIANDFGTNVILRNRGNGTFSDVSDQTGAQDFATSMGVAVGDINNDGHSDIYVANMFSKMGRRIIGQVCEQDYPKGIYEQIKGSCAGNRLYMKRKNRYHDLSEAMGVNAVGWAFAPALCDLDNDGWLDIYATSGFMSFTRKEPDG